MTLKVGDEVKVIKTGHQRLGKTGRVSGTGKGQGRYLINFGSGIVEDMLEKDLQKIEEKGKWDHKHGLAPKGADFTAQGGATASAASLAEKKISERIEELFGKHSDTRAIRLKGLPSHVAALNNELAPPTGVNKAAYDDNLSAFRAIERSAVNALVLAAGSAGIDFPPIAVLFPILGRVVILSRKAGVNSQTEDYFASGNYATTKPNYLLDANLLGPYYQNVAAYANHAAYSPAGGRWVCILFEQGLADGY